MILCVRLLSFFVHGQGYFPKLGQEGVECFQQDMGEPESYSVRVK